MLSSRDSKIVNQWLERWPSPHTRSCYEHDTNRLFTHVRKPLNRISLGDLHSFAQSLVETSLQSRRSGQLPRPRASSASCVGCSTCPQILPGSWFYRHMRSAWPSESCRRKMLLDCWLAMPRQETCVVALALHSWPARIRGLRAAQAQSALAPRCWQYYGFREKRPHKIHRVAGIHLVRVAGFARHCRYGGFGV
jgi:hypothetical protein